MKLSDEELNKIIMKADDDLDRLKDRCHDLYEENKELKGKCNMYEMNMYREENEKNKYKEIIDEVVKYIRDNYSNGDGIIWHSDMKDILDKLERGKNNEYRSTKKGK